MITGLLSLLFFLLLIFFHEFGHFLVSKLLGIKVYEFAVGMGPGLKSFKRKETTYSLRAFPLGGFCVLDNPEIDPVSDPNSFYNDLPIKRILVFLAGPLVNFIIAILIFFIISFNQGVPSTIIKDFSEDSALKEVGFKVGDEITAINDIDINSFDDLSRALNSELKDGESVSVKVYRDYLGVYSFNVEPKKENGKYYLGFYAKNEPHMFIESVDNSFKMFDEMISSIGRFFKFMISGKEGVGLSDMTSPIGVVNEINKQANKGIYDMLFFLSYISINLGFFNLIPIPGLDGSKIVSAIYEMIFKKKVNKNLAEKATKASLGLILFLSLFLFFRDILVFLFK